MNNRWIEEYRQIEVPKEMKGKVEEAMKRAETEKRRTRKRGTWKWAGAAAAVLAVVLVLPNTSQTAAAAMQQIPVLGALFKVVTVREYKVEEERQNADVTVPEVVVPEQTAPEAEGQEQQIAPEVAEQAQQTAKEINIDIQQVTDQMVEEFKASMEDEGGYQDLYIDSRTLVDDDHWFTLELILYQGAGSGAESHRHYTIDKTTGRRAQLSDFYGEDYVSIISKEVREQMIAQMEADENVMYWVDDEEVPDWNFQLIKENQDFYVNADGKVVVCFDEYEVAPGSMGCVEFVLETEPAK